MRVQFANESFYKEFEASEADTNNRLIYEFGDGQWDIPSLQQMLTDTHERNNRIEDFEIVHASANAATKRVFINVRRISTSSGHPALIVLSFRKTS
jgi:two-component system CheB/CheR fusion protein